MAREEAKAAEKQEAKGLTPDDLWNMLDLNKDGLLSMGEFKKGVQKNDSLQYLLFTGNNPDVATMKAVFKKMHVRRLRSRLQSSQLSSCLCTADVLLAERDACVSVRLFSLLPAGPSPGRGTDHQGALSRVLEYS